MYRTTQRIRKAGVAALVAATALSGLAYIAPTAGAITGGSTLAAVSSTSAGIGKTGQAAGNWTLTPVTTTNTWASGEQVTITVDDSDGTTCVGTDTLGFSSLPTVTNSGTATFIASIESSDAACTAAGVKDRLRLNFTGTGTGTFTISGVSYNVGATAAGGQIMVTAADSDLTTVTTGGGASNAFLTATLLTANNPPKGAAVGAAGSSYAISPIVITEQTATAADGDLCIMFNTDIATTPTPAPTVAVTGGTDTAVLTVDTAPGNADTILVNVTASNPASTSTFTISGINLETDTAGHFTAKLRKGDCTGPDLTVATPAGYAGNVTRFAGSDRFVTAQVLFENQFATCGAAPDNVVIARGDLFPDALAASYLAGSFASPTGVLLTNSDSVPAATLNALRNRGINNVYLVGGTSAISAAVATELDGTTAYKCDGTPDTVPTLTVQRIGGVDRYDTAKLVAEFPGLGNAGKLDLNGAALPDAAKTAIVASGENFPDALAAGPLSHTGGSTGTNDDKALPLLLSGQAAVPAATLGALTDLGIVNVVVLGGTAAVSDAAVAQLTAAGYNVRRIAGANRQATAAALATAMVTEWGFSAVNVVLARGDNFPDALAGGPWAGGTTKQAILLTGSATSLSSDTGTSLAGRTTVTNLNFFGGTAAVSAGVIQEALDAASQ